MKITHTDPTKALRARETGPTTQEQLDAIWFLLEALLPKASLETNEVYRRVKALKKRRG